MEASREKDLGGVVNAFFFGSGTKGNEIFGKAIALFVTVAWLALILLSVITLIGEL